MFWFLPLLAGVGGLIGASLAVKWVISYLDKEGAKERIQEQKKEKFSQEVNGMIGGRLKEKKFNSCDLGLESSLEDNSQSLTRNEIIDILVYRYDYERSWLEENDSLESLQILLEQVEGTSYTSNMGEVDWVLEDEESRRLFAGKYYNGEVVSMEEIEADEIDPELQRELDTQEIVIL